MKIKTYIAKKPIDAATYFYLEILRRRKLDLFVVRIRMALMPDVLGGQVGVVVVVGVGSVKIRKRLKSGH